MGSKWRVVGSMDEQVAEFVVRHNPALELGDVPYTAIGNLDHLGNIGAGVVFNNYTRRDVHLHVAGVVRGWCTRRFIGEVFRYVFVQLGCERCTAMVAVSNERALNFDLGLGFVWEGTIRRSMANGEDCHILGMLREECRWLKVGELNHGKQRTHEHRAAATAPVSAAATIPLTRREPLTNAGSRRVIGLAARADDGRPRSGAPDTERGFDAPRTTGLAGHP